MSIDQSMTQLETGGKPGVSSPRRGDCCCNSTLRVGEDGESMLPLEYTQFVRHVNFRTLSLSGVLKRLTCLLNDTIIPFLQ